eukprot:1152974-Pelagomonas_calceolata.AAC.6
MIPGCSSESGARKSLQGICTLIQELQLQIFVHVLLKAWYLVQPYSWQPHGLNKEEKQSNKSKSAASDHVTSTDLTQHGGKYSAEALACLASTEKVMLGL